MHGTATSTWGAIPAGPLAQTQHTMRQAVNGYHAREQQERAAGRQQQQGQAAVVAAPAQQADELPPRGQLQSTAVPDAEGVSNVVQEPTTAISGAVAGRENTSIGGVVQQEGAAARPSAQLPGIIPGAQEQEHAEVSFNRSASVPTSTPASSGSGPPGRGTSGSHNSSNPINPATVVPAGVPPPATAAVLNPAASSPAVINPAGGQQPRRRTVSFGQGPRENVETIQIEAVGETMRDYGRYLQQRQSTSGQ
ncbi:unnamed protein product [Amoebophrya sp. A120]|nr:unnamed protein product [Amoebophrya sp. A120]|eukprot:GSA120T00025662001.1